MTTSVIKERVESFGMINEFAKISVDNSNGSHQPVVQYTGKVRPVLSVGTTGRGKGGFNCPYGVVVEQTTGYIYVAEMQNHRVQVFNAAGEYLFEFGSDQIKYPFCIAIYKDRVFVTQAGGGCVLAVFDLDGRLVQQIGTPGSREGQFLQPYGIAIHKSNGDIYICDFSGNNIQIFSNDYSYKSQFGVNSAIDPCNIQLTENSIFVLSYRKLYTFDYNLTQVTSIVCDSICKHLWAPRSFFIDRAGNFIISDFRYNSVVIFDNSGLLIHKLTDSILDPIGVTLNPNGGIIVVGRNNKLLIF